MSEVTMLELRKRGRDIVRRLERGEKMALTYRGKRVGFLTPDPEGAEMPISADDPIHAFVAMAEPMGGLSNEEMDQVLYGEQADLR
ncbi:MAG: hypothetical protein ACOYM3_22150 [Terrimicrobiaceae bacterium]